MLFAEVWRRSGITVFTKRFLLMPDNGKYFEVLINILGYREDGEWVALALEMDLRGYGDTFEAARDDLEELIEMQISFAVEKGAPDSIWKAAESHWFERWAEARRERLLDLWSRGADALPDDDYRVGSIPPPHVIAGLAEFRQVDA